MRELDKQFAEKSEILTISDCKTILKNALGKESNFELLNYQLKPANDSFGYLGEYHQLNLEYLTKKLQKPQKMNLFVKTLPYKNLDINKLMKDKGIMRKETLLYVNLLNELQNFSDRAWCAKCYLGRKDLIVLENVKDLNYQIMEDQTKFFTKSQIVAVLESLASMHASSIAYEVKNAIDIGEKFKDVLFELSFVPKNAWFEVGMKTVIELAARHPNYENSPAAQNFIATKLEKYLKKIMDIVEPSKIYRNVFSHRDLWSGNLFFKNENDKIRAIFVDFQLCRYSPPAIDVMMALYLGLKPQERKKLMHELSLHYYEEFCAALERQHIAADEHMSWLQFQQSLEDLNLFGAFYNCICATILRLPANFLNEMKIERPAELDEFMHVKRTETILKLMQENEAYCEYVNECVADLIDYILSRDLNERH